MGTAGPERWGSLRCRSSPKRPNPISPFIAKPRPLVCAATDRRPLLLADTLPAPPGTYPATCLSLVVSSLCPLFSSFFPHLLPPRASWPNPSASSLTLSPIALCPLLRLLCFLFLVRLFPPLRVVFLLITGLLPLLRLWQAHESLPARVLLCHALYLRPRSTRTEPEANRTKQGSTSFDIPSRSDQAEYAAIMFVGGVRSSKLSALLAGAIIFIIVFAGLVYNQLDSTELPHRYVESIRVETPMASAASHRKQMAD